MTLKIGGWKKQNWRPIVIGLGTLLGLPGAVFNILIFICTREGKMLQSFTICYSALCFSLSTPLPSLGPGRQTLASCSQDRRVIIWTQKDGGAWTPKWELKLILDPHLLWLAGCCTPLRMSSGMSAGQCPAISLLSVVGTTRWFGDWQFPFFSPRNCHQVSLWKETLDEQWQCISDVSKGASNAQGWILVWLPI